MALPVTVARGVVRGGEVVDRHCGFAFLQRQQSVTELEVVTDRAPVDIEQHYHLDLVLGGVAQIDLPEVVLLKLGEGFLGHTGRRLRIELALQATVFGGFTDLFADKRHKERSEALLPRCALMRLPCLFSRFHRGLGHGLRDHSVS